MSVAPCGDCGHGADEHRLSGVGIPEMPTTASVEIADRIMGETPRVVPGPFRCVVEGCSCPDYVDEPLSARKKA